ncbi:oligosaccharide flippase family protein [Sphingomonas sp. KRR8]|uniref:lipopolysaccharide biosynthesis protein n=1 Tax=Sphingomonas sp. KRR8 TaxID=2942996 RepID=UPI0020221F60|nr:oligosaccharide flippase family protein [Sphingomonas sp. KRR8]URD60355.1 oligosaccharide flippase family protein [Sphingomonas sp. KRR8]
MTTATTAEEGGALRRIFANLGLLASGKIGAGLLSLCYVVIVTHALGATNYGILILLHGYTTLIGSLIAFSGFHGVVRYGNFALQAGEHGRLMRLIRFMALLEIGCGAIAILIAMVLVPFIGPRLGWSADAMRFAIPYAFAIVATVRATPYGILQIAERFDLLGFHQLINPLVRLGGCLLTLALGGGLVTFLTIWLLASLAEGLSMWALGLWILRKMRLSHGLVGPVRGTIAENEGLLPFIVTTNVDITLSEMGPKLAPLTVGWMLGPAAAGIFSLAQRASVVLQQPAQMLANSSYAVVAKLIAQQDFKGFRKAVWHSAGVATAVGVPMCLILGTFADPIMHFIGGRSFTGSGTAWILSLTAAGRLLTLGTAPVSPGLIALGLPNKSINAKLMGNLLLYPALPPLLWWLGLNGAGWHALLQSAVIAGSLLWSFRVAVRRYKRGELEVAAV